MPTNNFVESSFWNFDALFQPQQHPARDAWKTKTFKDYNFDALGIQPSCGHLHPLMKVRTQFRQIFLEMGYIANTVFYV